MEILEEKKKVVYDMTFDMSAEEKAALLEIGEKIYPDEQREKDILQYVVLHALEEIVNDPDKLKKFVEEKGGRNVGDNDTISGESKE
jgi:hypothetical protein